MLPSPSSQDPARLLTTTWSSDCAVRTVDRCYCGRRVSHAAVLRRVASRLQRYHWLYPSATHRTSRPNLSCEIAMINEALVTLSARVYFYFLCAPRLQAAMCCVVRIE